MPPSQRRKQPIASPSPQSKRKAGAGSRSSTPSSKEQIPSQAAATDAPQGGSPALHILLIFPLFTIIAALSLTTWLYGRALESLYGSVPTNLHLDKVIWAASILGTLGPAPPLWTSVAMMGTLFCSLPNLAYWVPLWTARWHDPVFGPVATHLLVLFPVAYSGIAIVKNIVSYLESQSNQHTMLRFTILPACATSILGFRSLWNELPIISSGVYADNHILLALGGFVLGTWAVHTLLRVSIGKVNTTSSSRFLSWQFILPGILLPILPILLPYLQPPILPHPLSQPFLHPNFPLRILSSIPSVTGMVVVGEILPPPDWQPGMPEEFPHSFRYLRASHSLLGGVWLGAKVHSRSTVRIPLLDQQGNELGDSIYSAFVLQEALRLVDRESKDSKGHSQNALIIGLGAGIAATALSRHDIATTIVEIDPAVYNASRQYFGLPDFGPDRVFLEDARSFVRQKRQRLELDGAQDEKFDFVVHDCFSGGGVPAHIFTVQFWEDLKKIMHVDGVVAVNFAGKLSSDPSKAILTTLQHSFEHCRAFHDAEPMSREELLSGFINMVFFCSTSSKPLTFRTPRENDFLSSHLRAHVFGNLPEREVDLQLISQSIHADDIDKWILRDQNNQLQKWQEEGALEHWQIMRQILPAPVWETF